MKQSALGKPITIGQQSVFLPAIIVTLKFQIASQLVLAIGMPMKLEYLLCQTQSLMELLDGAFVINAVFICIGKTVGTRNASGCMKSASHDVQKWLMDFLWSQSLTLLPNLGGQSVITHQGELTTIRGAIIMKTPSVLGLMVIVILFVSCSKPNASKEALLAKQISDYLEVPSKTDLQERIIGGGDKAVLLLIETLKQTNSQNKATIIGRLLSKCKSKVAISQLVLLLSADSDKVVENAIYAIDPIMPNLQLAETIVIQINKWPISIQQKGIIVLRKCGQEPAVLKFLNSALTVSDEWTKNLAACALAQSKSELAKAVLIAELKSNNQSIRQNCTAALGWYSNDLKVKKILEQLTMDSVPLVSQAAHIALRGYKDSISEPTYFLPAID